MKKKLLPIFLMLTFSGIVNAQTELAVDQNPNFSISRDKYMKMADSLNKWHSTTLQNTYRAIDWRADKDKAREDRREFRQQLRLERARWSVYDYRNDGYFNPSYSFRSNYNYSSYGNYRWQRPHFWWF